MKSGSFRRGALVYDDDCKRLYVLLEQDNWSWGPDLVRFHVMILASLEDVNHPGEIKIFGEGVLEDTHLGFVPTDNLPHAS